MLVFGRGRRDGRTFDYLVEVEYEEDYEKDVLDVVAASEPVPYGGDEGDYYGEVEFVPCTRVW
jgi:hypothetical protein